MAFTPLTTTDLANFLGTSVDGLPDCAPPSLENADLIIDIILESFASCLSYTLGANPNLDKLLNLARLDLANALMLERRYAEVRAKPFQSETIGSYSYSKSNTAYMALNSRPTGVMWLDFLLRYLDKLCADASGERGVVNGGITVFEYDDLYIGPEGRVVVGPELKSWLEGPYPHWISTQEIHDPNEHR